jgi:hypothetical protein
MDEKLYPEDEDIDWKKLLVSQRVTQKALLRVLEKKGIISKDELIDEIRTQCKGEANTRNRRQHRRLIKRCEIDFSYDNLTFKGISSNFSVGGLFIRTKHPLPPDTVFDMVIHLPDESLSKLKGKVARSTKTSLGRVMGTPLKVLKDGMGVKIIEKDAHYLHLIKSLLSSR